MDSMEKIYIAHSKMVYGFLLSKCGDGDLAEELTQETFYQAVKNLKSFRGDSRVSTWLCGIAANVWRTYLKKRPASCDLSIDQLSEGEAVLSVASAETAVLKGSDNLELMKVIHCLKEPLREVVYLRLTGNLSFREIGQIMGQSENWARVNFYRGKEKILEGVKKLEK